MSDHTISRRKLVGTLGAGLAAAALPLSAETHATSIAQPMADPTTKYPSHPSTAPSSQG
ncbi:hypothetical protein [Granulicella arctica]|uniref:hypothetical protein n=1 Tax=Granulicella arctica TaxID=940613 RepID=UPI0021E099C5|nr:hypothetical protein [Granulicella arctica]